MTWNWKGGMEFCVLRQLFVVHIGCRTVEWKLCSV